MNNRNKQAHQLLHEFGLKQQLSEYGKTFLTGSYRMDLMVWNDLDLYVDRASISLNTIYEITQWILPVFRPVWFEGRQDPVEEGNCYFIGFETRITGDLWNVDIRFLPLSEILANQQYCDDMISATTVDPTLRDTILTIKSELIERGLYGTDRSFSSMQVYDAVIHYQIRSADELIRWQKAKQ
ncbi:MAG: hypothetical protein JW750_06670 [Anaerolineaceae bacterium]|nr:hypothetical protein [Anaerolineaceae bacterium]